MPEITVLPQDEDAVLKEVWNIADVEAKTELTDAQIEAVNKLQTLAIIFDDTLLRGHVNTFMVLQKSRNRKSMDEFVNVVRAKREDFVNKGKGFFSSMLG
jgi:hypothetical protein